MSMEAATWSRWYTALRPRVDPGEGLSAIPGSEASAIDWRHVLGSKDEAH